MQGTLLHVDGRCSVAQLLATAPAIEVVADRSGADGGTNQVVAEQKATQRKAAERAEERRK